LAADRRSAKLAGAWKAGSTQTAFWSEVIHLAILGTLFAFDAAHGQLPPPLRTLPGDHPSRLLPSEEKLMSTTTKKAAKEKTAVKLVPLGDRVVLKRADSESKTKGGIVLPDTAKDKPQKGEVVAVGDGYVRNDGSRVPLSVKIGDDVIFNSYGGEEIKVGDEEYLLLRESDILATF
jgi:chaperonin GroES